MKRSMSNAHLFVALVIGSLSLSVGLAAADPCQDCTGAKVEDPKLHGRSIKSYWANKGTPPDTVVLKKGLEQGHLALCGNPTQWEWAMFSGMFAAELHRYEEAGCYFSQSLKNVTDAKDKEKVVNNRDSYWVTSYNQALTLYTKEKDYEGTIVQADDAIALNPENCKAYALKGPALLALGKTEEALQVLGKARELCPEDSTLATNEFNAIQAEADKYFEQATKAKGDSARVPLYTKSIEWYERAAKINPNDPNIRYQMGTAQMYLVLAGDSTKVDAARNNLAGFLPHAPNRQDSLAALYNLVVLESEGNNPVKASEYADLYLALDPRDADGYRLKAKVLSQQGTPQLAESYIIFFNAMSKGKPVESWDSHYAAGNYASTDLAKAVKERGNPEEARTYKDSSGNTMDALFYWTKGEGMAFYAGSQRGAVKFPAQAQVTKQ